MRKLHESQSDQESIGVNYSMFFEIFKKVISLS